MFKELEWFEKGNIIESEGTPVGVFVILKKAEGIFECVLFPKTDLPNSGLKICEDEKIQNVKDATNEFFKERLSEMYKFQVIYISTTFLTEPFAPNNTCETLTTTPVYQEPTSTWVKIDKAK